MTAQELYNQAIRLDFLKKFHEGIYVTQIGLVPMCFPAGSEGLSLITAAANQGYAPAQYQLALYYLFEHEHRKAATKHIEDNHTRFAACQTLERNEQGKGMQLLESVAHQNHGDACLLLGDIYSENTYCGGRPFGTVQNNQKAFEYYNKGAHSACADAMYRLGCCYYYGEGTAESNATADTLCQGCLRNFFGLFKIFFAIIQNKPLNLVAHGFLARFAEMQLDAISGLADFLYYDGLRVGFYGQRGNSCGGAAVGLGCIVFSCHISSFQR